MSYSQSTNCQHSSQVSSGNRPCPPQHFPGNIQAAQQRRYVHTNGELVQVSPNNWSELPTHRVQQKIFDINESSFTSGNFHVERMMHVDSSTRILNQNLMLLSDHRAPSRSDKELITRLLEQQGYDFTPPKRATMEDVLGKDYMLGSPDSGFASATSSTMSSPVSNNGEVANGFHSSAELSQFRPTTGYALKTEGSRPDQFTYIQQDSPDGMEYVGHRAERLQLRNSPIRTAPEKMKHSSVQEGLMDQLTQHQSRQHTQNRSIPESGRMMQNTQNCQMIYNSASIQNGLMDQHDSFARQDPSAQNGQMRQHCLMSENSSITHSGPFLQIEHHGPSPQNGQTIKYDLHAPNTQNVSSPTNPVIRSSHEVLEHQTVQPTHPSGMLPPVSFAEAFRQIQEPLHPDYEEPMEQDLVQDIPAGPGNNIEDRGNFLAPLEYKYPEGMLCGEVYSNEEQEKELNWGEMLPPEDPSSDRSLIIIHHSNNDSNMEPVVLPASSILPRLPIERGTRIPKVSRRTTSRQTSISSIASSSLGSMSIRSSQSPLSFSGKKQQKPRPIVNDTPEKARNRQYDQTRRDKEKALKRNLSMEVETICSKVSRIREMTERKERNANFADRLMKLSSIPGYLDQREMYEEAKVDIKNLYEKKLKEHESVPNAEKNKRKVEEEHATKSKNYEDARTAKRTGLEPALKVGTAGSRKSRAKTKVYLKSTEYDIMREEHDLNRERELAVLVDEYVRRTVPQARHLLNPMPVNVENAIRKDNLIPSFREFQKFVSENPQLFSLSFARKPVVS